MRGKDNCPYLSGVSKEFIFFFLHNNEINFGNLLLNSKKDTSKNCLKI
jgi:hypothetical protein